MALIPWWIRYPNVNDEIMNLDWLLKVSNENTDKISNFINLNIIKYADPILWDITSQYEANTITVDPQTGDAYISTKAVPYGVALSNTDYWTKIYNYADEINKLEEQIAAANERLSTTASAPRAIGDLVWLNGLLYKVTAPMIAGDSYVTDSNCKKITIEEVIKLLRTSISNEVTARTDADNALQEAINDEKTARIEADSDLQESINNEVTARIALSSIINNRNIANVKDYGAIGDGVADDTAAFNNAINSGYKIIYVPSGTFKLSSSINIDSNMSVIGNGTIIDARTDTGINFEGLLDINGSDNVLIADLKFKGSGAVASPSLDGAFVVAHNSTNIKFHNLYCSDVHENYALIFDNCSNSLIDYCTVINSSYCAIANLNEGNYVTIDHCYVKNVIGMINANAYGIVIHSGNVRPITAHHLWCTNNYVEGVTNWEGIDAHGGDYITCVGNTVIKCRTGIAIFRDDARTITCKYANVSNNTVIGFDTMPNMTLYTGIVVGADYSTYKNNYISKYGCDGNIAVVTQNTAMDIRQTIGAVIEDNYFYDNTGVCLHFRGVVFDMTIKGNVFDKLNASSVATDGYYKYALWFASGDYGRIIIENNDFRDYDCIAENPNFNAGTSINYLRYKNNSYKNGIILVRPNNCVCEYVTSALATGQGEIGDICYYVTSNNTIIYYMCVQSSTKTPAGGDNAVWRAINNVQ